VTQPGQPALPKPLTLSVREDPIRAGFGPLADEQRWVAWKWVWDGVRWTKVPYIVTGDRAIRRGSSTDPTTWRTLDDVMRVYKARHCDGIGLVPTKNDRLVGLDLDKCLDPITKEPAAWAAMIVKELDSYTELTPRGVGLRVWVWADWPDLHAQGRKRTDPGFEMYNAAHYLTVTGAQAQAPGTPTTINERTAQLAAVAARMFPEPEPERASAPSTETVPPKVSRRIRSIPDDELLQRARSFPRMGSQFVALYDRGECPAGKSDSEADWRLARILGWLTGGDEDRVEAMMRATGCGLRRPKWDEPRPDTTYLRYTIRRALATLNSYYTPSAAPAAPQDLYDDYTRPADENEGDPLDHQDGGANNTVDYHADQRDTETSRERWLMTENVRLRHENRAFKNPYLNNGAARTIVVLVLEIERLTRRGQADAGGYVRIPSVRIAERARVGENTALRHIKTADDAGIIEKLTNREWRPRGVNPDTGEIKAGGWQSYCLYKLPGSLADAYRAMANYVPPAGKPKWGGKRVACPDHPDAPVNEKTTWRCSVCGRELKPAVTRIRHSHTAEPAVPVFPVTDVTDVTDVTQ
jgi:hypothetical protein